MDKVVNENAENCWEYFGCSGRYCPAYEFKRGKQCWMVNSTTKQQVSGSKRSTACFTCPWYKKLH